MTDQGEALKCKISQDKVIKEATTGPLAALPGCNPVQYGPEPAPPPQVC